MSGLPVSLAVFLLTVASVVGFGSSSLVTEERVLIFSWSVWTWPRRLIRAYRYNPRHSRIYDS